MQRKKFLSFLVIVLAVLSAVGCALSPSQLFPERTINPLPPSIAGRTISQNFRENLIWHKDDINIRHHPLPTSDLLVGSGYIAFVNFLGGPSSKINRLEVLDARTGNIKWQSELFSDYDDTAMVGGRIFVLLNEGRYLTIYDVENDDNRPLFSSDKYFKAGTIFYLFPVLEGTVKLYYQQGNNFFIHSIDSEGIEVGKSKTIRGQSFLFLFDQPFYLTTGAEYVGGNLRTGEELWRIEAPGQMAGKPILENNRLIFSTGDGKRYALMAIDIQTGRELWKTDKVFGSNVVLYKNSLYALRNDAVLVKLNLEQGEVQKEIPFTPASIDAGLWAYWLASDGERLFVYFGDSQELFALEL